MRFGQIRENACAGISKLGVIEVGVLISSRIYNQA